METVLSVSLGCSVHIITSLLAKKGEPSEHDPLWETPKQQDPLRLPYSFAGWFVSQTYMRNTNLEEMWGKKICFSLEG